MKVIAEAINQSKREALEYYGGNIEDANDMLIGVEMVVKNICKLIGPEEAEQLRNTIEKCA